MCTKTEEKILIASKPFIKKCAARTLVGCNYKNFSPIWKEICNKYESEHKIKVPSFGIPTPFFLREVGISVDQLVQLAEYEKRFSE